MTEQVYDPERPDRPLSGGKTAGEESVQEAGALKEAGPRQLPLPFRHERRFDRAGFVTARSNAAARAWLFATDGRTGWPDGRLVLWGGAGRGKTHLLHLWARRENAAIIDVTRDGLPDIVSLMEHPPRALALDGLPESGLDEIALLRIINTTRERHIPLLMTACAPPGRWRVTLPDLESRLRATPVVEVGAAEDVLLQRLMLRLLAERQLVIPRQVSDWLLQRLPREALAVEEAVSRIDRVTLETGQPFDRAAAARLLAAMHGEAGG